jgi:hypothetical protein
MCRIGFESMELRNKDLKSPVMAAIRLHLICHCFTPHPNRSDFSKESDKYQLHLDPQFLHKSTKRSPSRYLLLLRRIGYRRSREIGGITCNTQIVESSMPFVYQANLNECMETFLAMEEPMFINQRATLSVYHLH